MTGSSGFWIDRPVFVTGATGLVGSWLVRRLVEAGADVACLVRDGVPNSEFVRSGLVSQVRVVRGDLCDAPLLQRALAEYEIRTLFHLEAQTIVGLATREPVGTLEANRDGAAVYMLMAEALAKDPSLEGEAFNFSCEQPVSVIELVKTISRLMDGTLQPVILNEAPNEIRRQVLSARKAHERLNWTPLYSLESGLGETIDWYRGLLGETK